MLHMPQKVKPGWAQLHAVTRRSGRRAADRAAHLPFVHHKLSAPLQRRATLTAALQIGRKAHDSGQAQPEKQREQTGQGRRAFQRAAQILHQGIGPGRAFGRNAQRFHKAQTVGRKAHAPPVLPQGLRSVQKHGLFQIEKIAAPRGADPAVQAVEHIQTTAEASSAAAAAEGKEGQQPVPAAEHLQPEVGLAKVPHTQHQRAVGPFGHGWAGGNLRVRTWPLCPAGG